MNQNRFSALSLPVLAVTTGILFAVTVAFAQAGSVGTATQSKEPPLSETRLPVHTLVREDIFAGFLSNDMKRFARGEKSVDMLLEQRPDQKANLLAWKGGAALYRAVLANESHRDNECQRHYHQAIELFAQAAKPETGNDGVNAVTGGTYLLFADRLPKANRAAAWEQAYNCYSKLWKQQSEFLPQLPIHHRGELLGGLAMSAARTGHTLERDQAIDKMTSVLRDTPYEPAAKKWKANPKAAGNPGLACLSCHDSGRLDARITALDKK